VLLTVYCVVFGGVQAGTTESSRLQYTVNSTFSLNYEVQPSFNDKKNFSLKMTQQGQNMQECVTIDNKTLCAFVGD
jgi:hypothetical protein